MRSALLCACGIVLSQFAFTQSVAIPGSGVIFDAESHGLRPVNGIAGSATLGLAIPGAADITTAAVCSTRRFALVAGSGSFGVSIVKFDNSPAASLPAGVLDSPDKVVLNASCSAALLFSASASQIQLIGGLPDSPVVSATFPLQLAGVSSFALSDDGSTILCVVPADAVYAFSPSVPPTPLLPLEGGAGVTFQNIRDALIADSAGNRILAVSSVFVSPAIRVLAGQEAGISSPDSIAYSTFKQQILIGNSGTSSIVLFSLGDNAINLLPCGCQGSFASLGNNIYEVAAPANGVPLLVLDANSFTPKVLFVPARQ